MSATNIPFGSPLAVKRFSTMLFEEMPAMSYWHTAFMANETAMAQSPVQITDDLKKAAGDTVQVTLRMNLIGDGVYGDDWLEGNQKRLSYYTDNVIINRVRCPTDAGGKMSAQRTVQNMRKDAKELVTQWCADYLDENFFFYLAGARGVNTACILSTGYTGIQDTQGFVAPDSSHQFYTTNAITSAAGLTSADKMTLQVIERAAAITATLGGGQTGVPPVRPIKQGGKDYYVFLMHTNQQYDLRQQVGSNSWWEMEKALTTSVGKESELFKGGLGMVNNMALHVHKKVVRFNDAGAGGNVETARASVMGAQSLIAAFAGSGVGKDRYSWVETFGDLDNSRAIVTADMMLGIKRPKFNSKDVGSIHFDTAAVDA